MGGAPTGAHLPPTPRLAPRRVRFNRTGTNGRGYPDRRRGRTWPRTRPTARKGRYVPPSQGLLRRPSANEGQGNPRVRAIYAWRLQRRHPDHIERATRKSTPEDVRLRSQLYPHYSHTIQEVHFDEQRRQNCT